MPLPSSLALTTIADGSTIVAADHRNNYTAIQTNVNQTLGVLGAAWTAYSPVWTTSGTAPALGNGTLAGRFLQVGKLVISTLSFVAGSTTTFGTGTFFFSLPATSGSGTSAIGNGMVNDASANSIWTVAASQFSSTNVSAFTTGAAGAYVVNNTQPFTWAVSDSLVMTLIYEAT